MKDFYDIYYLARTFDFEGRMLQEAIYETLANRERAYEKCSISDIIRLTLDSEIQNRWNNFRNKILNYDLNFTDVVNVIISFTSPPCESILSEDEFSNIGDVKKEDIYNKKYLLIRQGDNIYPRHPYHHFKAL